MRSTRITKLATLGVAVVVCCLLATTAMAQTTVRLTGRVVDDFSGAPVPAARVTAGQVYHATADDFGLFLFESLPAGEWTVIVSAAGYDSTVVRSVDVTPDIANELTVRLKRREYEIPGIEVTSQRENVATDGRVVISRQDIEERHPRDLLDLLSQVEGVMVQGGGGAEVATVSIRGCAPEHVLVLVDGQRIDMSANAGLDLNSIPIDQVQQVTVTKGGASAEYGANALGGVIAISTHLLSASGNGSLSVRRSVGRWQSDEYAVGSWLPLAAADGGVRLGFSDASSRNDYDFEYSVEPRPVVISGTRANNRRDDRTYFASGIATPAPDLIARFSLQSYRLEAGLPGPASRQSDDGFREDNRWMGSVNLSLERGRHNLALDLGGNRYTQYFEDTAVTPAERYLAEFVDDRYMIRAIDILRLTKSTRLTFGSELQRDIVTHTDLLRPQLSMGKTRRDNASVYMQSRTEVKLPHAAFFDLFVLDGSLRQDWATTHKDSTSSVDITRSHSLSEFSPKVGAAMTVGEKWTLTARANWGESYRLPTLNALFWQGDVRSRGNPGLRPERSDHLEGGLSAGARMQNVTVRAEISWYRSNITDLIVWRAAQGGVWRPDNLAGARLSGHEESISAHLFNERLTFRYQNSISDARNRVDGDNNYDNYLTFRPSYQTRWSAILHFSWLRTEYSLRQVGRRFATEANTRSYPTYEVHDLHADCRLSPSSHWTIELSTRIDNIWNEDYVLIAQYPMPGRYWQVGLSVTFQK